MIAEVAGVGAGFKGAINYLLLGKKDNPNPDRVAWVELRNLATDKPEHAARLMRATASQSARCRKPLYHLVLSWREDEAPTDERMRGHVEETIRDLDLTDHQAMIAAHTDTRHRHVHLIFNRVHPETAKAWSRSMDYARLEVSLRRQLEARGLAYVPGRHNDPGAFGLKTRRPKRGEYQKAIHNSGPPPLGHWSTGQINERRDRLLRSFGSAQSWDQLARMLAADGITLKRKGQGIVLEGADGFMKLSELRKDIRLGSLESLFGERFGDYAKRNLGVPERPRQAQDRKPHPPLAAKGTNPKPKPPGAADDENDSVPDQAEIERLREEARLQRIARREEDLRLRADERRKDKIHNDEESAAAAAAVPAAGDKNPAVHVPQDEAVTARGDAFDALGETRRQLDLAKHLHAIGVIGDAELERARRDVEGAEENLDPLLTLGERLNNDIADALHRLARRAPARPPEPKAPAFRKPKKPKFKKKDRDERER